MDAGGWSNVDEALPPTRLSEWQNIRNGLLFPDQLSVYIVFMDSGYWISSSREGQTVLQDFERKSF